MRMSDIGVIVSWFLNTVTNLALLIKLYMLRVSIMYVCMKREFGNDYGNNTINSSHQYVFHRSNSAYMIDFSL